MKLPSQKNNKRDFNHLCRADADRQERKFQPCPVAVLLPAKGCQQQENKTGVEGRDPLPALHQKLQIDHGYGKIHHDTDEQRRCLDEDFTVILVVPRSAEDHSNAIERRGAAKAQQNQVCALYDLYD